jgi:hypothetical protein
MGCDGGTGQVDRRHWTALGAGERALLVGGAGRTASDPRPFSVRFFLDRSFESADALLLDVSRTGDGLSGTGADKRSASRTAPATG